MTSAILGFVTSKVGGVIGWALAIVGVVGLGWFWFQYQYQKIDIMVLERENEQQLAEIAALQMMYQMSRAEAISSEQQLKGCLETFDKREEDKDRLERALRKAKSVPAKEGEVVDDESGKEFLDSYNAIHKSD